MPAIHHIASESDMLDLGKQLAAELRPGMAVFLKGPLGAGKTTLCRGLLNGLGHTGAVKSPTYALVEPYEHLKIPTYHFDLYRLTDPGELEHMGWRDYWRDDAIILVEWPEKAEGLIGDANMVIEIELVDNKREVRVFD